MEPVRKSQRELEIIYEADKIQHLLKKYLANQTLFVQGYDPPHPSPWTWVSWSPRRARS
jgi:hypothetical protein